MKAKLYAVAVAALMSAACFTSCTNDEVLPEQAQTAVSTCPDVIYVNFDQATRVVMGEGNKPMWQTGSYTDQILVYSKDENDNDIYAYYTCTDAAKGKFELDKTGWLSGYNTPTSSKPKGPYIVTTDLFSFGNFSDSGVNFEQYSGVLTELTHLYYAYMVGQTDDLTKGATLKNVMALLKVTIPEGSDVTYFELGANLAGSGDYNLDTNEFTKLYSVSEKSMHVQNIVGGEVLRLTPGDYYIPVIPQEIMGNADVPSLNLYYTNETEGLTDDGLADPSAYQVKRKFGSLNLEAGKIYDLGVLEMNVPFEDAEFKSYCVRNFDTDKDGEISLEEAAKVTVIACSQMGTKSLKGIEYFTSIACLDCSNNQLTNVDLSNNTALEYLYCFGNNLTSLDLSKNTALQVLSCNYNNLTSLDVSKNTALQVLYCTNNNLTSLDVSKSTALEYLYCNHNNLTSLDVSKNTALQVLLCDNNNLTSLDVSKNTALEYLYCNYNNLTSLDVSNKTALEYLYCDHNNLTSLDVSNNTALEYLYCDHNNLTSLDVSKNTALEYLYCYSNQLTSLDVSKNTALQVLYCDNNNLSSLDVSKNTALVELYCSENKLSSLDVSKNTALVKLYCSENKLSSLDLSKNTALEFLVCYSNQQASLNVSKNTALTFLDCADNRLTSLDVSNNTALKALNTIYNPGLETVYLAEDQTILNFSYDSNITTIVRK